MYVYISLIQYYERVVIIGTITVVLATLGYSIPAASWEKLFKKTLHKLLRTGDNCSDSFENDKKAF